MTNAPASWQRVLLGDVLRHVARPVVVEPQTIYREIGIRSHGKGLFHKAPISGFELGDKRVFRVEPGDFVLNIVFAWEGAVGLASEGEQGMIASHRFPTFLAVEGRVDLRLLERFFHTSRGVELMARVSPGGAGRNRTLNRTEFLKQEIPLPPLPEQQRLVARIDETAALVDAAKSLRLDADDCSGRLYRGALEALLDEVRSPEHELDRLLVESPRNGLSPKPRAWKGGRAMLRINAVSSAPDRFVDLAASNLVAVDETDASPFFVREGDVLLVRYNGDIDRVAKAAVARAVPLDAPVYPDKLVRLRVDLKTLDPHYLVIALGAASVRKQVEEMGRTTAGNIGINGTQIRSLRVPVPPLAVQRAIVAELDGLQSETEALKATQGQSRYDLDALLPAILDRAFAGAL